MKIGLKDKSLSFLCVRTLITVYEDIGGFKASLKNGRNPMEACLLRRDAINCYKTSQYEYLKDLALRFDENCYRFIRDAEAKTDECLKIDEITLMKEALAELKQEKGSETTIRGLEIEISK